MVTVEMISGIVNAHVKKILDMAALCLPHDKFQIFRKMTLDEFGKSGLIKELERVLQNKER